MEQVMVLNDYVGLKITNRPHATPNYGPLVNQSLKFIITDRHLYFQKNGSYMRKVGKIRSESNVFFDIIQFQLYVVCLL